MFSCPFLNEHCLGTACGNFNDPASKFGKPDLPRGCKGDNPTAQWARWYLEHDFSKPVEHNPENETQD